ncbi:MAG TPA: translational GTPase TypA [Candidatus Saccharimonadia bacterium]|nr:translational GTPase TypA [Candidatus Saccharimonadia bacterium]
MPETLTSTDRIRNVAIIAHVDHGKTTLVDGLLKQSKTFRENQAEMQQTAILDTGDLERERGITISAKTIAVNHDGYKINIIDTPGHADFSGEVERTLNMADGCLLIVDAQEGPMPQTKFVLTRALALGLKPVVVVNKIDKRDQRAKEVVEEVEHLFLDLAVSDDQLEFPVYFAIGRDGKAWDHIPTEAEAQADGDLEPIFNAIINDIPAPKVQVDGPFQMLVTSLSWDTYQGKYAIGRVQRGSIRAGQQLAYIDRDGATSAAKSDKLFVAQGLERIEVTEAVAGDIVWITGVNAANIGGTMADPSAPEALPVMEIEAPTLQIQIGPNTSPYAGREGKFTTSRQIGARLERELETNVGLRVTDRGTDFLVSGRGELHLSVLIETLRREGFELEVGRPQVVTKEVDGKTLEPREELSVEVPEEYVGPVTSELGRRRAEMVTMEPTTKGTQRLIFRLPTRALLGLRNVLITTTKGTAIVNSLLIGYEPLGAPLQQLRNGVLISAETGAATTYSLETVEERGTAFIGPGTKVYEGMIIGLNRRGDDMEINVTKEKKLTNVRASSTDMKTQLTPFTQLTLEEALDFIENDELLEVTPESLRMRKRYLTQVERKRHRNGL